MKRWITPLAVAMAASIAVTGLGTAAGAQTGPISPADALKRQLVDDRGVTMSKVTTSRMGAEKHSSRSKTRTEFGKGTVTATDVRHIARSDEPQPPMRFLTFEGRTYCQGWICPAPEGKTWVLFHEDEKTRPFLNAGAIDLGDPAALQAVLATTETKRAGGVYDGTRTMIHQGTVTYARLYETSPAFRDQYGRKPPAGRDAKIKVSWRIWLGEDRLARRVRTSWTEWIVNGSGIRISHVLDARLTGWGAETDIPVPSADETAGRDEWRDSQGRDSVS
ncbi:hypothetical protein Psi01_71810 [Planobispora siamensis]|uniref:Lipoprotein n=2 Tax=Planobispora siamensis TaxID=936338 RepID=A0A8J3SLC8_9ACTN|nr:hypothetical protein Psi01_71810 [Planobispora siamensis]